MRIWPYFCYSTVICLLLAPLSAAAQQAPTQPLDEVAGHYCPGSEIIAVMLEEVSLSFSELAHADMALINKERGQALEHVSRSGMALSLASSRGIAAQTTQLINAVINTKASEDYQKMVTHFPMLHSALLALPENAYTNAADEAVSNAESILKGQREGNALQRLRDARDWLSCDKFATPANQAADALSDLYTMLLTGGQPGPDRFEVAYKELTQTIKALMEIKQQNRFGQ